MVAGSPIDTRRLGVQEAFSKEYKINMPINVAPGQSVRGVATLKRGTLEVPYTITLTQSTSGVALQTRGTWKGASSWDLHLEVDFL